jgi:dolichol-phosphate mannosyltransferase
MDVVLPVHNEAATIRQTLCEFYRVVTLELGQPVRFVICEDGSSDNSVEVLQATASELPVLLLTAPERKGYSRAVIDGFRASTSEWICFIDSDGQCDPADLGRLIALRPQSDLILGYRKPRSDHWSRLVMSSAFCLVYRFMFPVKVKDPSCPYLLIRRDALEKVLSGDVGILRQGFWWEFLARAVAHGLRITEIPVSHRVRAGGKTQVYRPTKIPRIAFEHLLGLRRLRQELNTLRTHHP